MSRTRSLWLRWLAGVVALWVAAFTLLPEPEAPPPLTRPAERWELPPLPEKRSLREAANTVSGSGLWGARPAADVQKPPEDTRWAVAGTFIRAGEPSRVVVRFAAAKPAQTLKVGDHLPDGAKVALIEPGRVCAVKDRKRECLPVPPVKRPDF